MERSPKMPITVAMIEEKEFKTKMRGYDPV